MASMKTPVSVLGEFCVQQLLSPPIYTGGGSDSSGQFVTTVKVLDIEATGRGRTKKASKHDAAHKALKRLFQLYKDLQLVPRTLVEYMNSLSLGGGSEVEDSAPNVHVDTNEKDMELEENLYCKLCNIYCMDGTCFQAHMNGKLHKKNENRENSHMAQGPRLCRVCNVRCSGPESYNQHIIGTAHKKRIGQTSETNTCICCDKLFFERDNYLKHMELHMQKLKAYVVANPSPTMPLIVTENLPLPHPTIGDEKQVAASDQGQPHDAEGSSPVREDVQQTLKAYVSENPYSAMPLIVTENPPVPHHTAGDEKQVAASDQAQPHDAEGSSPVREDAQQTLKAYVTENPPVPHPTVGDEKQVAASDQAQPHDAEGSSPVREGGQETQENPSKCEGAEAALENIDDVEATGADLENIAQLLEFLQSQGIWTGPK